jgi:hypothetical protein
VFVKLDEFVTIDHINNNFLKFPIAQGAETLTDITVLGTSTFNGTETHNNAATFKDVVNIGPTGVNSTTLDTNGSGDFVIQQNSNSQRIIMTVKDLTGAGTNTASLGALATTGWFASSSIGQAMTAISTVTDTIGSFYGLLSTANINAFSGKSNKTGSTNGRINLGVSGTGTYNSITSANDAFVVGANTATDLGSLTLTTWSSSRLGIRINSNSINSVETAGQLIQLNATTTGGLTSSTTQPGPTDSSTSIPTTAWVQSAIASGGNTPLFLRGYKHITNTAIDYPITFGTIPINFTNGATLRTNDVFTIRYSIRYDFNITSSTSQSNLFYSAYGNLNIYPHRVSTNTLAVPVYLNGSLNGSSAYGYQDATVAPRGRYIWTENFSNPELLNVSNKNDNPIFITSVNQTSLTLNLGLPYQGLTAPSNNCSISVYLELINTCSGTTITTGNTTFFDSIVKNF